jgi:hypothetical protein
MLPVEDHTGKRPTSSPASLPHWDNRSPLDSRGKSNTEHPHLYCSEGPHVHQWNEPPWQSASADAPLLTDRSCLSDCWLVSTKVWTRGFSRWSDKVRCWWRLCKGKTGRAPRKSTQEKGLNELEHLLVLAQWLVRFLGTQCCFLIETNKSELPRNLEWLFEFIPVKELD